MECDRVSMFGGETDMFQTSSGPYGVPLKLQESEKVKSLVPEVVLASKTDFEEKTVKAI